MLHTLVNLFAAPRQAFSQLRNEPSWLAPMLVLLGMTCLTTFAYFHFSDPELVIDDMLAQAASDMTDAELADARESFEAMSGGGLKWASTGAAGVGTLVFALLHAAYFALASMFSGTKIGFKSWLSFVTWSNMPMLFSLIAGLATLFFASGYVPLSELNPLSMTNLLRIDPTHSALVRWGDSLDLTRFWSVGLMVFGYRIWTEKSWLHCCLIVLVPILLLYGVLFVMAQ